MATIDNLDIKISASANDAIAVMDRLAAVLGKLGRASGKVKSEIDKATRATDANTEAQAKNGHAKEKASDVLRNYGNDAKKVKRQLDDLNKSEKDAGKSAKTFAERLQDVAGAFKRILFYRVVRSIIREIGQAFKEGATNLYNWSRETGKSDFAKNLDRIATSINYLKNSLGAMLEPIVRVLAPIIDFAIDGIVEIINWINKLFAALSGSQTYTVAKKVAKTWGDAADDVSSSAQSMSKEIKRTILGFDEINKLDGQNNKNSGSGNQNDNSLADMFEERQLDGWMAKLAEFIDKFNLQIPAVFAGIVAGFELVKAAIKGVADLSLGWLKEMAGKTIDIAVSLVRSGWTTIKSWALKFGSAVVDLAVRIKTKALELWMQFATAWAALNPVLKVGIAISVTAALLWLAYQIAWNAVPDKVLEVQAAIQTKAEALWKSVQDGWYELGQKTLGVTLSIITSAELLWSGVQKKWYELGNKVLGIQAVILTKAAALWKSVQDGWYELGNTVLGLQLAIQTKASALWKSVQDSWYELGSKALGLQLVIQTKAAALWKSVQDGWYALGAKVLGVTATIVTTAQSLWKSVQDGWYALGAKVLGFSVAVTTVIDSLWGKVKEQWDKIPERVVSFSTEISNTVESLWDWVTENWEIVAAGALGIAVAIATPWGTLAAMLTGLWAEVMAGLGGSVAFAVTPVVTFTNPLADLMSGPYTKEELIQSQKAWEESLGLGFGSATGGGADNSGVYGTGAGRNSNKSAGSVQSFIDSIKEAFSNGWSTINTDTENGLKIIRKTVTDNLVTLKQSVENAMNIIAAKFSTGWANVVTTTGNGMIDARNKVSDALIQAKQSVENAMNLINAKFTSGWETAKATFKSGIGDATYSMLSTLSNSASSAVPSKMAAMDKAFASGWATIKATFQRGYGDALYGMYTTLDNAANNAIPSKMSKMVSAFHAGFNDVNSTVQTDMQTITSNIDGAIESMVGKMTSRFKSGANDMVRMANSLLSNVERASNAMIRGLNDALSIYLEWDVPDWAGGGKYWWKWDPNIPEVDFDKVDYLAKGAILNMPTMLAPNVVAGEAGSEAVLPLDQNTGWMDDVADRVAARNNNDMEIALLREQNSLLQQLLEKDIDISTAGINNAQRRTNRRAGITVVPVGQ